MADTAVDPAAGAGAGAGAGSGSGPVAGAGEPVPRPGRRGPQALAAAAVAVTLVVALAYLAIGGWRSAGSDLDRVRAERQGVEYLRPLTALLTQLSEARAAATAGEPVDQQAIGSAAEAVEAVDARDGDALGVRAAWTDLRRRIGTDQPGPAGAAAFPAAGDAVDRTTALIAAVHQRSSLAADPDPATRALGDAVLSALPDLVASTGRYAATLALPATDPATTGLRAAAADRVGRASAALDLALRAGLDPGTGRSVTLGLVEEVRLAAADVVPGGPGAAPARTAAGVRNSATRLDDVAQRLADAAATGLDGQLRARAADVSRTRSIRAGVAALVLVLALGTLWARMPAAPAHRPAEELGPVTRGPADDAGTEPPAARLIDARALLREVEVVRVGRAVRSVPRPHRESEGPELEDDRA
jgi:hypothetical protein